MAEPYFTCDDVIVSARVSVQALSPEPDADWQRVIQDLNGQLHDARMRNDAQANVMEDLKGALDKAWCQIAAMEGERSNCSWLPFTQLRGDTERHQQERQFGSVLPSSHPNICHESFGQGCHSRELCSSPFVPVTSEGQTFPSLSGALVRLPGAPVSQADRTAWSPRRMVTLDAASRARASAQYRARSETPLYAPTGSYIALSCDGSPKTAACRMGSADSSASRPILSSGQYSPSAAAFALGMQPRRIAQSPCRVRVDQTGLHGGSLAVESQAPSSVCKSTASKPLSARTYVGTGAAVGTSPANSYRPVLAAPGQATPPPSQQSSYGNGSRGDTKCVAAPLTRHNANDAGVVGTRLSVPRPRVASPLRSRTVNATHGGPLSAAVTHGGLPAAGGDAPALPIRAMPVRSGRSPVPRGNLPANIDEGGALGPGSETISGQGMTMNKCSNAVAAPRRASDQGGY